MKQIASMGPDMHYNKLKKFPYYGNNGVNSGVMLMNLTRMRKLNFIDQAVIYVDKYANYFALNDNDLLNVFFHFNPGYSHFNYF